MAEVRSTCAAAAKALLVATLSVMLPACAAVDRFGSRIYDHNLTSQDAMNEETVLNIVRASRYQPLNFMAVTQVTGGQTETLTSGLPTITFGPAQTAMQHQFIFSNSVASGATGGYQSNPLVSSQFQQGMMSPVSPKVLTYLLASHDRETVFELIVDNIEITSGNTTVRYVNDPANDQGLPGGCSRKTVQDLFNTAESAQAHTFLLDEGSCNYSKFALFLKEGLDFGLNAELVSSASSPGDNKPAGDASNAGVGAGNAPGNATSTPQAKGRICWDPGLADPRYKTQIRTSMKGGAICKEPTTKIAETGGPTKTIPATKPAKTGTPKAIPPTKTAATETDKTIFQFEKLGALQFDVTFRSPDAIFLALGKLLRDGLAVRVTSLTPESQREFNGEPLMTIIAHKSGPGCYITAGYDGYTYCVPQGAYKTAMVIDILEQLRNLSITPNDLNSAFSVRLID
jgi:hypothetical protein